MEDWAEIRRLRFAEGMPIKQIARRLGISKNTVKAKLAADAPPRYQRALVGSVVDEVEPKIRELLRGCPTMPATVIAERFGHRRPQPPKLPTIAWINQPSREALIQSN